jgi:holin-like protein
MYIGCGVNVLIAGKIAIRKIMILCRRNLRLSAGLQLGMILAFWMLGALLARWSRMPVPGGIIGMFLVLGLLAGRKVSIVSLRKGANWLIAEMLLFFVPAVLAMLDHREFIGLLGVKVLAVILAGTIVVMSITALSADLCFHLMYAADARGQLATQLAPRVTE